MSPHDIPNNCPKYNSDLMVGFDDFWKCLCCGFGSTGLVLRDPLNFTKGFKK